MANPRREIPSRPAAKTKMFFAFSIASMAARSSFISNSSNTLLCSSAIASVSSLYRFSSSILLLLFSNSVPPHFSDTPRPPGALPPLPVPSLLWAVCHPVPCGTAPAYTGGAWNLRNVSYYDATNSSHYHLVTAKEWKNGNTTYNQNNNYTPTQYCPNLASGDQTVTLKVNWSAKWYLCRNGYTCLNSIPDWNDCTYNASKITSDNNIRGYTITGESGKYFTTTIEVSKKDKKVYIWKGCLRESAAKATADCASTCVG